MVRSEYGYVKSNTLEAKLNNIEENYWYFNPALF